MPDGNITLSVTLSAEDIKAKANELRNAVQRAFDSVSAKGLDKSTQQALVQMDKLVSKSDEIIAKMRQMETTKVTNPEVEKLNAQYDKLLERFFILNKNQIRGLLSPSEIEELTNVENSLHAIEVELQKIHDSGRMEIPLSEAQPDKYNDLANALGNLNNQLVTVSATSRSASSSFASNFTAIYQVVRTVTSSIQRGFKMIESTVKKVGSAIKNAFNSALKTVQKVGSYIRGTLTGTFSRLRKSVDGTFSSTNFKKGLTTILKYGFGVRSLYFAFRKLRNAVKEGIENLVQYDSANNLTNQRITELQSSLLFLKNAWAAAFAPIINVVVPILNTLIDAMAQAANAIARFIGYLTGQTVVLNAVKVDAQDYAESLGGVGSSAGKSADKVKKLTDRLASFDDLNVLGKDNDDEDTGAGGGGGLDGYMPQISDMFEWVDSFSDLADRIKKAWENADFTEIGIMVRDKIVAALRKATDFLEDFREIAYKIGKSFITFLNGVFGDPVLWIEAGKTLGATVNVIGEFIRGMLENNTTDYGGNFAEFINSFIAQTDFDLIKINLLKIADFVKTNLISFLTTLRWEDEVVWDWETMESYNRPGIFTMIKKLFGAIHEAILSLVGDAEFTNKLGNAVGDILDLIAQEINDAVNKLTPRDFEDFGKSIGSLILTVLSNINEFMNDTSGAFDTLVDNIGIMLSALPWEDIFDNAGDIAVKIINAIIKVLNMVGQHMNDVQENGKTLAENLGAVIGECISQIDFEGMGETFGLIAEGIIDGISSALSTADISSIFTSLVAGFEKADPDSFKTVATLAIWGVVAKAIFDGILKALPLIFSTNGAQLVSAIGSGLSGALSTAGGSISSAIEGAGIGGWGASQTASSTGSFVAGGIADFGALATAIGGVLITLQGVSDAWKLTTGEINETDFGGINTKVVESEGVWDNFKAGFENAFSSFDQFRLTFAMGIQGIGDAFAWLGENTVYGWEIIKTEAPKKWGEIKTAITNKYGEVKDWIEDKSGLIKDNLTESWENLTTNASEKWGDIKDSISEKFGEAKDWVDDKKDLIRDGISTAWDTISTKTQTAWEDVKNNVGDKFNEAKSTVEEGIAPLKETVETKWQEIQDSTMTHWDTIKTDLTTKFEEAKLFIEENIPLLQETIQTKWEEISTNTVEKWTQIKTDLTTQFEEAKTNAINKATDIYNKIKEIWQNLKGATYEKFLGIKNHIIEIFRAIANDIKAPLNAFLSAIERMVNGAVDAINALFDKVNAVLALGSEWLAYLGLPSLPKLSHLAHVSVPRLAEGAVIPPNKEFLAVLGDQSHGTNIEAPLDTIKQAVAEVVGNNTGNQEVVQLLQELIRVVESKDLTIGDKEIGKANARYVSKQQIIRGTSF